MNSPKRCIRLFSTTSRLCSHVGSASIMMPEGVRVNLTEKSLDPIQRLRMQIDSARNGKPTIHLTQEAHIAGPKGELKFSVADFIRVKISEDSSKVNVGIKDESRKYQMKMWGTTRALINNGVKGVSEGHLSILKLVGTGYRALVENDKLTLRLGYSVPTTLTVPEQLQVKVPSPNRIIIEGVDKQKVKEFAAVIRRIRPPEPYKGKGVFVDGETIKLKQRKIK